MFESSIIVPQIDGGRDKKFKHGFGAKLHDQGSELLSPEVAIDLLREDEKASIGAVLEEFGFCTFNIGNNPSKLMREFSWRKNRGRRDPLARVLHQDNAILYCPGKTPWGMSPTLVASKTATLETMVAALGTMKSEDFRWWTWDNLNKYRSALSDILDQDREYEDADAVNKNAVQVRMILGYASWLVRRRYITTCNQKLAMRDARHLHQWTQGEVLCLSNKHVFHASMPKVFSGRTYFLDEKKAEDGDLPLQETH
ncbi:MAG: hypothetical protein AAB855_01635 [Patescibacteria group bacterium]